MELFNKIDLLLGKKDFVVVSIDGCAAAGKSSLALKLKEKYHCPIVKMDDFFLPLEKRTPNRLSIPGGNIDYERFKVEVVEKLGSSFSYGAFNCNVMKIDKEVFIEKSHLVVVEGSYSLHPYFGKYYDLSIFLDIDETEQIQRIKNRDGDKMLEMFVSKWIKYEQSYHDYYDIKSNVDIYIK